MCCYETTWIETEKPHTNPAKLAKWIRKQLASGVMDDGYPKKDMRFTPSEWDVILACMEKPGRKVARR